MQIFLLAEERRIHASFFVSSRGSDVKISGNKASLELHMDEVNNRGNVRKLISRVETLRSWF